ncbi:UDP-N-acetylmuramate--L-alanine ligase [Acaryochloris thomasi]|nr:UDP-N-acetylmuramate--L-alanine ligase [Acaryochloris thomasi]
MPDSVDLTGRPVHFIGIGGIGMSALAHVLVQRNLPISGSDVRQSSITQKLQALGAQIFWRQDAGNLTQLLASQAEANQKSQDASPVLPQVVCSTAIHADNPEYRAAVELGCPIFHRSDVLAALIKETPCGIAVAGTHGKTTTSSLLGYVLLEGRLDPSIVVGGEVAAWNGNARVGNSPYLVAEADESDGSLVKFSPKMGVITNIELDHPDHYTTLDQVLEIFQAFVNHCQCLIVCIDCPNIRERLIPANSTKEILTYSLNEEVGADYSVRQVIYTASGTVAQVLEKGELLGEMHLNLLGEHNLSNALAAVAIARQLNLDFPTIANAMASFEGARRRFEHRGEAQGICFIDDYAHHPSEITATLASARLQVQPSQSAPAPIYKRVIAVFQPHRFSRTHTFLEEFSQAFSDADVVLVTDIYSAGEEDSGLIDGEQVTAKIAAHHSGTVCYQPELTNVTNYLCQNLCSGDLVMFLGAGNLNRIIPDVLSHFQAKAADSLDRVALP